MTQRIRALALIACFSLLALLSWWIIGELWEKWIQLAIDNSERTQNPWRSLNPAISGLLFISALSAFIAIANLRHLVSPEQLRTYESAAIPHFLAGSLVLSIFFSALFYFQPALFISLGREDGLVENCQVLCFAMTATVWLYTAVTPRNKLIVLRAISILLFLGFLFVAGEEISWGQRIFGFETPEFLSMNSQGEANLHNVDSGLFNDLFLYGAFALFGLAPFTYFPSPSWTRIFHLLRPDPAFVLVLAAGAGFHPGYADKPGQFLIFVGLLACSYQILKGKKTFIYILGFCALFLATFLSFFMDGLLDRWWILDEYRELFFSSGILLYTISVAQRVKNGQAGQVPSGA